LRYLSLGLKKRVLGVDGIEDDAQLELAASGVILLMALFGIRETTPKFLLSLSGLFVYELILISIYSYE